MKILVGGLWVVKLAVYSFLIGLVLGLFLAVQAGIVATEDAQNDPAKPAGVTTTHQLS